MITRDRVTHQTKFRVKQLYNDRERLGLNQKMIAERVGISPRSVKRILDEAGLATAVPLLQGEARSALEALKAMGLKPSHVGPMFRSLEFMGVGVHVAETDKVAVSIKPHQPTPAQIVKAITELDQETWGKMLHEIVTARVAKSHNVGVSTAMLNIMNAVDKNAKA
jgi:hypothetical protein